MGGSKKASRPNKAGLINGDGFLNCRVRPIGSLKECMAERRVCQWVISFGGKKFCCSENAKQFIQ